MKNKTILLEVALIFFSLFSCNVKNQNENKNKFVFVDDGQLIRDGKPYYYIGANLWYGAILGSEGEGGDRNRLCKELDMLKSLGVDNIRVLVGSDGERNVKAKVEPTLQVAPGVYNDTIFAGLDFLLFEMSKRDMLAVLYLNNSWEWSGGYGQYLQWAGYGKAPAPSVEGYEAFMNFVGQFSTSEKAKNLFYNYVNDVITRTNRYTGVKYVNDPTIMSWQIGNEPRAFSNENKMAFAEWIKETASLIKSLDKNHLVSTGSEGVWGCEMDMSLYEQIHSDKNIDYMNIHIWPYNWGWVKKDSLVDNLERAKSNTRKYIDEHMAIAQKHNKPLVLEEFGYPRDGFRLDKDTPTTARDGYYEYIFSIVNDNTAKNGLMAGCNFWAWGGDAIPSMEHEYWAPGDDLTGDPAQEAQGLNSVFSSDSGTMVLIKEYNEKLGNNK